MRNFKTLFVAVTGIFLITTLSIFAEEKPDLVTRHFTFHVSGGVDSATVRNLANTLESNYARITDDLQTTPYDPIKVNIYSAQWRYIIATGNWFASGHIEGPAILHFVEQSDSQNGSWKIALHEFTHAVVLKLLIDEAPLPFDRTVFDQKYQTFPVWLWEAVSVYEAKQFREPKSLPYLNSGSYPSLEELSDRSNGGKIYGCGYTIIEYILEKYGKEKLISLIANYGNVQKVLMVSEAEFSKGWYEFVGNKYLK